ncbi:MAG: cytochrome C peroxidase [Gammaproteobacteria bacterium]|nr:cytochrome C peroxidase [Gammaproteobacteria bacterium]
MKRTRLANALIASGALTLSMGGLAMAAPCRANPCAPGSTVSMNPCAAKNPCAARNPCAANNTCSAANPCAAAMGNQIDSGLVTRPKHYRPYKGAQAELVTYGKELFNDTSLSTNGMSCNTCHQSHGAFNETFTKPYPHFVKMPSDRSGLQAVHLDEMVQFCMVAPMAAQPLPWDGKELAALTAYTATLQKDFKPRRSNPCTAKSPCAAANPCAAKNPCKASNPCAARNPCAPEKQ